MTISAETSRVNATGNGATATYPYTFRIFDEDHLLVTVKNTSDVETTLTKTTDYTVTGVGASGGGNVVLVNASQAWLTSGFLTSGYTITIRRVLPLTQETDIRNQGDFYPESHEDEFDKLVMVDQQQQDEIDRSIKLPESLDPVDFDAVLPEPVASRLIGFNATADGLANFASAGNLSVSPFMETVLDDTTASAALTTLGVSTFAKTILDDTSASDVRATIAAAPEVVANTSKTGNYTATTSDYLILCDDTSASFTVTLYAASGNAGRKLLIKKTNSSSNTVTIDGNSSETIDGATTQVINNQYDSIEIVCNGTNWNILNRKSNVVTVQTFTSGSGTYTKPGGATRIKIKLAGAGGGGSGGGNTSTMGAGGNGGNSTFGSSLLTCTGGGGGGVNGGRGSAGSATVNSPAISVIAISGGTSGGGGSQDSTQSFPGGMGGVNALGGCGGTERGAVGSAGAANTGAGGGGGGGSSSGQVMGAGGGAGAYIEAIINSPSATYSYAVGSGGTAGTAGTSGFAGGSGGSGVVIVEEYYN